MFAKLANAAPRGNRRRRPRAERALRGLAHRYRADAEQTQNPLIHDDDDTANLRSELADVTADIERVVAAICKVETSAAVESKLKELEQRQRPLNAEIVRAETVVALPDRAAIVEQWQTLVEQLGSLPKLLRNPNEIETARSSLKDYIGEVRVDRTGMGHAELCLQRGVAGA